MEKVFEIYIRTTPERLWEAITSSDIRSKYQFGSRITSDWTRGSRFEMAHPNADGLLGEGVNLEIDPPRRLVQSMIALWSDEVKNEGPSRITWEILSGLKTWLETGELLTTPGSLMYGNS